MAFGKIAAQVVNTDKLVELQLNQLAGEPILIVAHLGESNKDFWLDSIAKANAQAAAGGGKQKLSPARIKEMRSKNRATVIKYAAKDVTNLFHDDGTPATKADLADIVNSLPDDVFDSVLLFCSNADNFRERPINDDPEATKALVEK